MDSLSVVDTPSLVPLASQLENKPSNAADVPPPAKKTTKRPRKVATPALVSTSDYIGPYVPPTPEYLSPVSEQIEVARGYGEQLAKEQTKKLFQPPLQVAKKQAAIKSENDKLYNMSDEGIMAKLPKCNKLNDYRKEYHDKIDFTFKREYSPDMDETLLDQHINRIELILNSRNVAPTIKKMIKWGGKLIATVGAIALADTGIDFQKFEARVVDKVDKKHFDDEITQLSIEWREWLARKPLWRVGEKFIDIGGEVMEEQLKALIPGDSKVPTTVDSSDL
jgi:hypothetical protein